MLTFDNDPKLKEDLLGEIKKHQEADEIAQGSYKSEKDGKLRLCAVGCALHSLNVVRGKTNSCSDHAAMEKDLGIPCIIARLEDGIFEGLKLEEAKSFPYEFIEAIPVGVDLNSVWPKFAHWLLVDSEHGVIKFAKSDRSKKVIQDVADLYAKKIAGEDVTVEQWKIVRAYAAYAYADAAYADAAADAYADAAYAYAYAYAYADDAAADAAADAAYADAKQKIRSIQKNKLLELIREVK